jgi:hypothetical protein
MYGRSQTSSRFLKVEFTETEERKPCTLHNGYAYRKYRINKEGVLTRFCLKEKSNKCKGRLVTENNDVLRVSGHQPAPDEANTGVEKAIHNAKKRISEDLLNNLITERMTKLYGTATSGTFEFE